MPDIASYEDIKKNRRKNTGKNNLISMLTADVNSPQDSEQDTLEIDSLIPYPNHPFKLYEGERFDDMVRSVKELGVLLPVIVRPLSEEDETYEILSGHNRVNAAKMADLNCVPVIIKRDLSDDEAKLIVTETNLVQRSFADLSHSERAVALNQHLQAVKSQGKRNDLLNEVEMLANPHGYEENSTCGLIDHKSKSRDKVGYEYGLDSRSVSRYVRLNELIPSLLQRVRKLQLNKGGGVIMARKSRDVTAAPVVITEKVYNTAIYAGVIIGTNPRSLENTGVSPV